MRLIRRRARLPSRWTLVPFQRPSVRRRSGPRRPNLQLGHQEQGHERAQGEPRCDRPQYRLNDIHRRRYRRVRRRRHAAVLSRCWAAVGGRQHSEAAATRSRRPKPARSARVPPRALLRRTCVAQPNEIAPRGRLGRARTADTSWSKLAEGPDRHTPCGRMRCTQLAPRCSSTSARKQSKCREVCVWCASDNGQLAAPSAAVEFCSA